MVHAAWGVHWRHRRRGLDRYSNLSVAISRNVSWIMNYFKHSLDTGPFRHRLWCLSDCQQEQTYWRFFFSRPMLNFVSFFLINILFPNSAGCWLALEHDITLLFYWFISSSFFFKLFCLSRVVDTHKLATRQLFTAGLNTQWALSYRIVWRKPTSGLNFDAVVCNCNKQSKVRTVRVYAVLPVLSCMEINGVLSRGQTNP